METVERRNLLKLFGVGLVVPTAAIEAAVKPFTSNPPLLLGHLDYKDALTFRGGGEWGTGKGAPLTVQEIDNNFFQLHQRLLRLEEALKR
jgi:hypothetical protein